MEQPTINQEKSLHNDIITVREASAWASEHLGRTVTPSNVSYLIQYGRVRKINANGSVCVDKKDLENYYSSYDGLRELNHKAKLGDDINWSLSFSQLKEAETTKHVHRLHPYKGKFIPQLVEYFIDDHTDKFKKEVYFNQGDIILDPFCGSGTTLVQCNECGINAVGIDISAFNALISNCKLAHYNLTELQNEVDRISNALNAYVTESKIIEFENALLMHLNEFNIEFFPVPEYKYKLRQGEIIEALYGKEMEAKFLPIYYGLIQKHQIKLTQKAENSFIEKWFSQQIRDELNFVFERIKEVKNQNIKKILTIVLSRTMRSCRATTHSDLATLVSPVTTTYYCSKHGKICKPLFSIMKWWNRYCKDTITRLASFKNVRSETLQYCLTGDSRNIDIIKKLSDKDEKLMRLIEKKKIAGIFSSPPYVGLIDYHEQHAYAYDLFGFTRNDDCEIGPLYRGRGKEAQRNYVEGISQVLINCKRFLADNYNVFLVANDKHNLYPSITEKAGMHIVNTYHRPVLNRSERDKAAYSEVIFHLREGLS